MDMERRIAIIGAGVAGLAACRHAVARGLNPVVLEAEERIGGLWAQTIESTKVQTPRWYYEFPDFPWPSSVQETYPHNTKVLNYIQSYAQHFGLLPYIKLRSKVISLDYVGVSEEEMQSWELWGGTGLAFGSKGKWHLLVEHTVADPHHPSSTYTNIKEYVAEFVVICTGKFSGLPNIPEFPPGKGPEVFEGKVIHSVEYAAMDNASAAQLIKGKKVAVVGSQKSAVDVAAECANANGPKKACTLIQRTVNWILPGAYVMGVSLFALFGNRFAELLVHKPGESFIQSILATLLTPLLWGLAKFLEMYLRWKYPLKKYKMIPKHSMLEQVSACKCFWLPDNFYEKVEEGSLILKQSSNLSFCKQGLLLDSESEPIEADIVILATGYKSQQKLRNLFTSKTFQNYIMNPPSSLLALYRQMIPPRIPGIAIIGHSESLANLYTFDVRCQWLAHFLDEKFKMPSIKEMEKDVWEWEKYMRKYSGEAYRGPCIGALHIWYNDQLCRDVGCNPRRKKGWLLDLVQPYGPPDYVAFATPK
ncbi:probable flavin-containing monooxygenase 1 [Ipomoea triloba]|uniref:probable flavin-containing monooxygenase 1 n=1 Tax=Ipomoea triloba TaxID=35885 RepID=UPI00125E2FE8|nr:probable flavin-containing monooxygenase 1 [Ipomoea triloba]